MAWKVYGFMEGKEGNPRFPQRDKPVYGPLPRKIWIPVKGEKYKLRKLSAPATKSLGSKREITSDMAVKYARWLAARDSIPVRDDVKPVPVWAQIMVAGKVEMRVSAVMFANVRIDIPNWDWVPAAPVESVVDAETAFADLLPLAWFIMSAIDTREPVAELEAA